MKIIILLSILILNFNIHGLDKKIDIIKNEIKNDFFYLNFEDLSNIKSYEIEENIKRLNSMNLNKNISTRIERYITSLNSNIELNRGRVLVFNNFNVIKIPKIHFKNDCSLYLMINDLKYCGKLNENIEKEIKSIFFNIYDIKIKENVLKDFYILHEYAHLLENNNFNNYLDNEIHADLTAISFFKNKEDIKNIVFKRKIEHLINFERSHSTYIHLKKFLENYYFTENFNSNQIKILNYLNNKSNEDYVFDIEEKIIYKEKNNLFIQELRKLSRDRSINMQERIIIQQIIHSFSLKNLTLERKITNYEAFYK